MILASAGREDVPEKAPHAPDNFNQRLLQVEREQNNDTHRLDRLTKRVCLAAIVLPHPPTISFPQ
jgi:hypothetical protein